jgi:hypothetical protein
MTGFTQKLKAGLGPTLGVAVVSGLLCALAFAASVSGAMPGLLLTYITPLPLFLIGFSKGVLATLIATCVATIGLSFLGLQDMSYLTAIPVFLFLIALPAIFLLVMALRSRPDALGQPVWYPTERLVLAMTGFSTVLFALISLWIIGSEDGVAGFMDKVSESFQAQINAAVAAGPQPGADMGPILAAVNSFIPAIPAIALLSWMILIALNAIAGLALTRRLGFAIRGQFQVFDTALPLPVVLGFALTSVLALTLTEPSAHFLSLNLAILLGVPFFFVGLVAVHSFAGSTNYRFPILGLVYILLSVIPWFAVIVAGFGVMEQRLQLHRRFAASTLSQKGQNNG